MKSSNISEINFIATTAAMSRSIGELEESLGNSTAKLPSLMMDETSLISYDCPEMYPMLEFSVLFDFAIPGILLTTVGLLGLIGNTLSIVVLSRPQMRQSINCILIGLAIFDIIVIVTSILIFGLPHIHDYLFRMATIYPKDRPLAFSAFRFYFTEVFAFITPAVYSVAMIAQTASVYLTLAVTLERFVAVCLPFRARSLCTYGRARYGVISVALFAVIYNLPRFFEVKWQACTENNATITVVRPTELRIHPLYISVYVTWAYLIFMYLIPFSCLAIFNFLIYNQVRKANLERSRMSRQEQKEISLATMLLVVVIVFFMCNVLALVSNILEIMEYQISQVTNLSNFLVTVNSSVNFIIYCIFNDKFKRIFCKLFCCQMFLDQFGIYRAGAGVGGAPTDTYVHRYPPESTNRSALTPTTSAPTTLLHNAGNNHHNLAQISALSLNKIETLNCHDRGRTKINNNLQDNNSGNGQAVIAAALEVEHLMADDVSDLEDQDAMSAKRQTIGSKLSFKGIR